MQFTNESRITYLRCRGIGIPQIPDTIFELFHIKMKKRFLSTYFAVDDRTGNLYEKVVFQVILRETGPSISSSEARG